MLSDECKNNLSLDEELKQSQLTKPSLQFFEIDANQVLQMKGKKMTKNKCGIRVSQMVSKHIAPGLVSYSDIWMSRPDIATVMAVPFGLEVSLHPDFDVEKDWIIAVEMEHSEEAPISRNILVAGTYPRILSSKVNLIETLKNFSAIAAICNPVAVTTG